MNSIFKVVTILGAFGPIAAATGQTPTDRYDGLWELVGNSEAYALNDGAISCPPAKGMRAQPMVVEESVIRNAFSEVPVQINTDGKFQFSTPSRIARVMGEFTSVKSGKVDMMFSYTIFRSTGPGCRLSFELKRPVQQEPKTNPFPERKITSVADAVEMIHEKSRSKHNVVIIKKNQSSRVVTLDLQPGICENKIGAYAIGPKPKHGTVAINLLNSDLCTFEVVYTPIKDFKGADQVGVMQRTERGSPLRGILPYTLHVE